MCIVYLQPPAAINRDFLLPLYSITTLPFPRRNQFHQPSSKLPPSGIFKSSSEKRGVRQRQKCHHGRSPLFPCITTRRSSMPAKYCTRIMGSDWDTASFGHDKSVEPQTFLHSSIQSDELSLVDAIVGPTMASSVHSW